MAKSNAIYPYPVLIIHGAHTVEWIEAGPAKKYKTSMHGEVTFQPGKLVPVVRDVRMSFYQIDGKPWDWARAKRLADACYPQHGPIKIQHQGKIFRPTDAPVEKEKTPPARVLRQMIRDYLAGSVSRAELERIAA